LEAEQVDVTVVGAGVVGLAIAAAVARPERSVLLLDRNASFGQETSSRHSGVIHAGIYYPPGSLKARLCVRGRRLLYELCRRYDVPHKKLGKLIVAVEEGEVERLEELLRRGEENGVEGLRMLTREEVRQREPALAAVAALESPETGIIDDHTLMRLYLSQAREAGAMVAFSKTVEEIERRGDGVWEMRGREPEGSFSFETRAVVNCGGLAADRMAELAGLDVDGLGYRLHYCLGEYFRLARGRPVGRPVYPLPEAAGLGIHLTPDMEGSIRLGPNARYVEEVTYQVDESQRGAFYESVRRYLPSLELEDVEPDFAGVRPKLQGPGEPVRDFVISHEADKGLPGLINLIGIESPGLTCSPAIGEMVAGQVEEALG
jgi:L-2-hydroxyglutarate oxidase LhgO